jgi:hypothetical protein
MRVIGFFQIDATRFIWSINHWLAAKASARWGDDRCRGALAVDAIILELRDSPAWRVCFVVRPPLIREPKIFSVFR